MADRTGKKEQCRVLYSQGLSLAKVAQRVGIGVATATRYKKQDKDTDQDWDKLRADLKGKTPPPKPNLVTFERPRGGGKSTTPRAPQVPPSDMDLMEVVNGAIASIAALLPTADNLQGVGGAASGLATLVRLKLEMENPETQLEELMKRYRSPHELIKALREQGWGRETA